MDPTTFYDDIASQYDLIFEDWEASMSRQGERIHRLIGTELPEMNSPSAIKLLDVSAGIGTQALPLARRGYRVTARDLSAGAIGRLRREASSRALGIDCAVGDMRHAVPEFLGAFDVVCSFDNSLPHLLTDDDLATALRACLNQLRPGGLFTASVRDYSTVSRNVAMTHNYGERLRGTQRYRLRQDWHWVDDDHYDATMVIELETDEKWKETTRSTMQYYAVTVDRLTTLMRDAGFARVRHDNSVFYQPVLIGHRAT